MRGLAVAAALTKQEIRAKRRESRSLSSPRISLASVVIRGGRKRERRGFTSAKEREFKDAALESVAGTLHVLRWRGFYVFFFIFFGCCGGR